LGFNTTDAYYFDSIKSRMPIGCIEYGILFQVLKTQPEYLVKSGIVHFLFHPLRLKRELSTQAVRYRNQHPPYSKPEDLLGIRLIRPEQVEKIRPYLRF